MNVKDMVKVQDGINFKKMNCVLFASNAIIDVNNNLIALHLRLLKHTEMLLLNYELLRTISPCIVYIILC